MKAMPAPLSRCEMSRNMSSSVLAMQMHCTQADGLHIAIFGHYLGILGTGAQHANGWLFVSRGGAPPDDIHRVLDRIGREWQGELLEFEASATEISAFWDEWGGWEIAATIAKYLRDLAGA